MSVANRLNNYLALSQTPYRLVPHHHTETAADSAHAAHIPSSRVVKSVLLRDRWNGRYLMALTPACNRVELDWIRQGAAAATPGLGAPADPRVDDPRGEQRHDRRVRDGTCWACSGCDDWGRRQLVVRRVF